jgi:putative peptidoglycan lipid II flippase
MVRRGELIRPRFRLPRRGTAAFAVFVVMGPMIVGMSLNQISSLLDRAMAYYLLPAGAVTYIYLANRLLLFPHALTAMSLGVAAFPKLALEATETDRRGVRETLDRFAGHTILVTLPASVGLMLLADDTVRVLFLGGEFVEKDVWPTVFTVTLLVVGLPFLGLAQLYARAFYAVGDARTPAWLAARLVVCNATLNLLLLWLTDLGTAGLALASSLSNLANATVLARRFRQHVAADDHARIRGVWMRSLMATGIMAIAVWLLRTAPANATTSQLIVWNLAIPIAGGIAVYAIAHWLLGSRELRGLRQRR